MIPTLESPRLIFRAFTEADTEAYFRCCSDKAVMQYIGDGALLSLEDSWRSIAFFLGHWQLRGYGMWAVTTKTEDRLIGRIGFHRPQNWPGLEIGWLIQKSDWGKGYATEGAHILLGYGREVLNLREIISLIHPLNKASIKVSEKIGGYLAEEIDFQGKRTLKYRYG